MFHLPMQTEYQSSSTNTKEQLAPQHRSMLTLSSPYFLPSATIQMFLKSSFWKMTFWSLLIL